MSILNGPRLNFWGGIEANVSLPNNSPTIPSEPSNPDSQETLSLFNLTTSTLYPEAELYSDDQLTEMINAPTGDYYTAGGWNHYGQHVVTLDQVAISSQGTPGNISTQGDLVGEPFYLLGSVDPVTGAAPVTGPMMVDLDPTGTSTSQIYLGGLQIGNSTPPQLLVKGNTVCSSYDLAQRIIDPEQDAPGSNTISGSFQVTFSRDQIISYNRDNPLLRAIIEAPGATGIVVRFVMFEMCPRMTTPQLDADYAAHRYTSNPSIGRVVGTLAPAFAGEPLIVTPGRQLSNPSTRSVGYASVLDNNLLSLDMLNIIPKQAFRSDRTDNTSPIGPNANFGQVSISAGSTLLSTLDPLRSPLFDYYVYGGIVDLPLTAEQRQAASLELLSIKAPLTHYDTSDGTPVAINVNALEQPYRLSSNQRNLYLEDYPKGVEITLQLSQLGQPVNKDTVISITAGPANTFVKAPYKASQYWDFLDFEPRQTVKAGQSGVTFKVTLKPGCEALAGFAALTCKVEDGKSNGFFINLRKFATTDFGIAPGSAVTWDQVYKNVLRFHYLAFPAMSRYIALNQQDAVWGSRQMILLRTSQEYLGTTLYMPVVRSMSASQRALLKCWLTSEPWQPLQ
ncbi:MULTISPECIES: hypothetical protein [Pseudomonas]|uniref:hypothetical protein n=1 Tax=Pseudomonas TaxID=286 RepID=UPI0008BBD01A|nr:MULTISPECIES: hypothetical protein [Pseudomonas]POA84696.1 hypothetical protein C1883_23475 [Pseudomonas protegens]BCQ65197.1 hypothetical protein PBOI14_69470 [Pseudomonas sp. Boi14]SES20238.1 hypothetical protein SAMN03159354_05680 [Pseudomonas sp. NFPP19]